MRTSWWKKLIFVLFICAVTISANAPVFASQSSNQYPKLANYYLAWSIKNEDEAKELAKWDLLVLDMEVQTYSLENLKLIRKYNPDIIILAYVTSQEIRNDSATLYGNSLRKKLFAQIDEKWWLKDSNGNKVSYWPKTYMLNVSDYGKSSTGSWNTILPKFMHDNVLSTGLWDGICYDNTWSDVSFVNGGNIDINNDGQKESSDQLDSAWKKGYVKLLNTANSLDPDKITIGNGKLSNDYLPYLNGKIHESFPSNYDGVWINNIKYYFDYDRQYKQPSVVIINTNANNTGKVNYSQMRYGFTSALLGNGYYSYDDGNLSHSQMWWFDEYSAFLGESVNSAYNLTGKTNPIEPGLWRRDFKNGIVLVNSSDYPASVSFEEEYEKIKGTQDPAFNDGSIVSNIMLYPRQSIIFLRPISKLNDSVYQNGAFAKVFNLQGNSVRNGFFTYLSTEKGGNKIYESDIDNDGNLEMIVANESKISLYKNNQLYNEFYPYGANYKSGINFAVGDLDNNGYLEIVTGTEKGGGPHVRIFNSNGNLINPGFFAFGKNFRGGVSVAVGDLNADGYNEIITGAGYGGGPQVRVFNSNGKLINPGFFAYEKNFRGGVNIAVGDVNGDSKDEIVTAPGYGGGPQVRVFNSQGKALNSGFFAYDKNNRKGLKIAVTDFDGNGVAEIFAMTTNVFTYSMDRQ